MAGFVDLSDELSEADDARETPVVEEEKEAEDKSEESEESAESGDGDGAEESSAAAGEGDEEAPESEDGTEESDGSDSQEDAQEAESGGGEVHDERDGYGAGDSEPEEEIVEGEENDERSEYGEEGAEPEEESVEGEETDERSEYGEDDDAPEEDIVEGDEKDDRSDYQEDESGETEQHISGAIPMQYVSKGLAKLQDIRLEPDPPQVSVFVVVIGKVPEFAFLECSGLEVTTENDTYHEGGSGHRPTNFVGNTTYGPIVLQRGMTLTPGSYVMDSWRKAIADGDKPVLYSGLILLFDDLNVPIYAWRFKDAWPTRWRGPSLERGANKIAIEELEIVHEGLEPVAPLVLQGLGFAMGSAQASLSSSIYGIIGMIG